MCVSNLIKPLNGLAPITDVTVIFPTLGERCPPGWEVLDETPTGLLADLNYGSLNSPEAYICYKRGRHKPPLVDVGVLYENKDKILSECKIVYKTPYDRIANVNNANTKTFITYRRARKNMPANELVVTNICVIITSKGEKPPHAFCVIKKNLNKGVFAQDVFLCYKKSMNRANLITYKPGILCRYPTWDRPDWNLHSNVPLFCLPMGATLEVWPPLASQPDPVFSTFVLTVSDASEKIYGSAVTFYERYPVEKLTEEQLSILEKSFENDRASCSDLSSTSSEKSLDSKDNSASEQGSEENSSVSRRSLLSGSHTFNVNKCICLLSHWPFFDAFEKFLSFLYKLSTTSEPHLKMVPIERYISHFLENIPFPSPQRPRILFQMSADEKVVLYQPEDIPLPRSGAGFKELLLNLSSDDYLLVLLLILTEHKILVHSLRSNILTSVVEALSMIMFPFKWQCPYIPLCPLGLAEVLHAPVPFLIGVDSRFFDMYDPPPDVTCIDLDTNNITLSEEKRNLTYKLLPRRAAKSLRSTLEMLCTKCLENEFANSNLNSEDCDDSTKRFLMKDKEQKLELEIQEAFLRFMATILKGYRSYLLPIVRAPTIGTTDPKSLFDLQGFLKSRDRSDHKFFVMLMKTQMFIRFIEERSFVSDMDVGLAFFDECTEKVEESSGRLLEFEDIEESHRSERTVFIPPPEPNGLPPGVLYNYQAFNLDGNLFKNKDIKNVLNVPNSENTPGSPMARRTKHEVKSAQKLARRKHLQSAQSWAKCLLTTCYSLWFLHLPSFVISDASKSSVCLRVAYELLVKIQKLRLHPTDEVCYRVMMQLFGIYSQPVLAVNLLSQMKSCGVQPNALTYGYYNRAVLEATWPSDQSHTSQLWSKLRNVILGAALFRRGAQEAKLRLSEAESCTSIASLEKTDLLSELEKSMRKRLGSIMKPTQQNLQELVSSQTCMLENSAGILMTGLKKSPPAQRRQRSSSDFSPRLKQPNPSHAGSKVLSAPRESSESLDITDDPSLDDSWSNHQSIVKPGNSKTESKTLMSRLNCLGSDWSTDDWTASQDSIESSECKDETEKSKIGGLRKSPTKSSESLLNESEGVQCKENRSKVSLFENRQSAGSEAEKSPHTQDNSKTPCNNLKNSSDLTLVDVSKPSQTDSTNCCAEESLVQSQNLVDGQCDEEIKNYDNSNTSKTSPIRTPVTENDPLGALQSTNEVNGTDIDAAKVLDNKNVVNSSEEIDEELATRMKYDLSIGGLFSHRPSKGGRKVDEIVETRLARRRENDQRGQGDDIDITPTRVPKSATFHNGRDKEAKSKTVPRGSTPLSEESSAQRKSLHRSTTLPDTAVATAVSASSVASSLSSFSSNFKFSFSRYSPSRFSLKKSDIRNAKTQILENAISGSKKSNELLLSGLNSVKSAASSVAKKIEEVISTNTTPVKAHNMSHDYEEDELDFSFEKNATLDFESWGTNLKEFFGDGSRKGSAANLQPPRIESPPLPEDVIAESLYGKTLKNTDAPSALVAIMTTCCKCNNCHSILYDEEIVAGWTPDDSNLNTKCHFCQKPTLPFLTVTLYDYRNSDKKRKCSIQTTHLAQNFKNRNMTNSNLSVNAGSLTDLKNGEQESEGAHCDKQKGVQEETVKEDADVKRVEGNVNNSSETLDNSSSQTTTNNSSIKEKTNSEKVDVNTIEPYVLEPIIVPYLNPLVLRKELENILHHEGDPSLTKSSFVDQHPIVYWNMVWVFERINFTSHLPDLILQSSVAKKTHFIHSSWTGDSDSANISIKCLWDNPRLYEEVGQPMYMLWQGPNHQSSLVSALVTDRISVPRSVMQNIINNLRRDKLYESMRLLVNERTKLRHSHSLYRDILFLAIAACDRANIILGKDGILDYVYMKKRMGVRYWNLLPEILQISHFLNCPKVAQLMIQLFKRIQPYNL
ncbi:hypothetical protein RUM44_012684 [Polyplax serrata]|uniref:C-myc promoter-binding protein n=1 Tax=Polyplax serrata TaxID=468196 RepID=A0ABR1BGD3_POLSC